MTLNHLKLSLKRFFLRILGIALKTKNRLTFGQSNFERMRYKLSDQSILRIKKQELLKLCRTGMNLKMDAQRLNFVKNTSSSNHPHSIQPETGREGG